MDLIERAPTIAERNEGFCPPHFDMTGGELGVTPILWQFRMAYEWQDRMAEEEPDWDQCCTCWVFALSESEARAKVWQRFDVWGTVMPDAIASCYPERFRNQRDDELDAERLAVIETRRAKTEGLGREAMRAGLAPNSIGKAD